MRRRTVFGLAAGLVATLAASAGALAYGAHSGGRQAIMRRMVSAAIDQALDEAHVTSEQRATIYAARDRVFSTVDAARTGHRAHLEETLRLFEADRPDPAEIEALHRQGEAARQRIRDTVHEAIVEAHSVLTPAQRKAVAGYVRAHRMSHWH
ncbi:MAG: Spy/CpxP family protein refolding chaperone [Candidatus Rokuibacteriota bacterium]